MIYFTSDHHFGHFNIIKYTNRNFDSVNQMDEFFVASWNSQVSRNDTVYYLGDFIIGSPKKAEEILKQLNGKIHLIKGNHDKFLNWRTNPYFKEITDYKKLKYKDSTFILMHYPLAEWDGKYRGSIHLHGHSHGKHKGNGRILDVGVDNLPEYREFGKFWSIDEVIHLMDSVDYSFKK